MDDDAEAYGGFGGGDYDHEENKNWPSRRLPDLAEGYEGEVDRVSMSSMDMKNGDDVGA